MADPLSFPPPLYRSLDQVLTALKKGGQLVKYGRKGKPKLWHFRLSSDETTLTWISTSGEKSLKLGSVSKIIPGQRTAVFQRHLVPEKDYLSFSLIYNNGKRSLDLICKDKSEAELWICGLRAAISSAQGGRSKIDGLFDGGLNDVSDALEMQGKFSSSDALRVSVSSAPSTSSHGSAPDDYDALGDVYIWGEVARSDVLLPRPLESNLVLDVHHISCGVRHAALVTRHGEVFTWGEESGGRLGHGVGRDTPHPLLVESLSATCIDLVACGEFHTCAVSTGGEVYTWGDGTHNAGLLGHGKDVSHWIPKRISGALEKVKVGYVACGPWHTALITATGQLFTFGVGTFGVLGHGDTEHVEYPREVESLSGLRTVAVACGVWHTAAIVEVIASVSSGKLFTWGDGDKNRLGHGDKEMRVKPTCVPALIDHSFHKLACGHSLTVGLTTLGQVFTMGSSVYGQLGNPNADGRLPCMVDDSFIGEVIDVACGAYHVAALNSKNEVYSWGKGANGRLGHGDVEDRKTPTLIESLKDRQVKCIALGDNYSTAICLHKWVSGVEQSQCSTCRQSFGFTRKRHNCYNCGLVHCHSCSSKKATGAALAPMPVKPHRVCDSCFVKLGSSHKRKVSTARLSGERSSAPAPVAMLNMDMIKQLDSKAAKQGKKGEASSSTMQLKDLVMSTNFPKPVLAFPAVASRSVSPFSRKASPPRSVTPVPTTSGLSFSKSVSECLKKTNEILNEQVLKLRTQVENLKIKCEMQEAELQKSSKKIAEAMALAADESAKAKAAKDVIKSLTAQFKNMAERLPPEIESMANGVRTTDGYVNGADKSTECVEDETDWIEQYEPGVYISLVSLRDGTRELKRVRFSRRRFGQHQAETWWSENREKVYEIYNVRGADKQSRSANSP